MNLLILLPKPLVRARDQEFKASVVGSQLNTLGMEAKRCVSACSTRNQDFIKYSTAIHDHTAALNPETTKALNAAHLIINCSGDDLSLVDNHITGTVLTLDMAFPGSFSDRSIILHSDNPNFCADEETFNESNVSPIQITQIESTTNELPPELHYAQFTPAPLRINEYKRKAASRISSRALAVLAYDSPDAIASDLAKDKSALTKLAKQHAMMTSLSLIIRAGHNSTISKDQLDSAAHELHTFASNQLHLDTDIVNTDTTSYRELYSALGKVDVGLFANSALFPDGLALGIPVYTWRDEHQTITNLNHFWEIRNLTTEPHLHRKMVATRQSKRFEQQKKTLVTNQRLIENDSHKFQEFIELVINHLSNTSDLIQLEGYNSDMKTQIFHDIVEALNRSLTQKIYHTLSRQKRKLKKLRQSPTRFIQDSEHSLVRHLVSKK